MPTNQKEMEKKSEPIEKQDTAAWQTTNKYKRVTKVLIPDDVDTKSAKDYVDTNQK